MRLKFFGSSESVGFHYLLFRAKNCLDPAAVVSAKNCLDPATVVSAKNCLDPATVVSAKNCLDPATVVSGNNCLDPATVVSANNCLDPATVVSASIVASRSSLPCKTSSFLPELFTRKLHSGIADELLHH